MVHAFVKLFNEGGWVLYPIFLTSVIVWYIGIGKTVRIRYYLKTWKRLRSALASDAAAASSAKWPPAFVQLMEKLRSSGKTGGDNCGLAERKAKGWIAFPAERRKIQGEAQSRRT